MPIPKIAFIVEDDAAYRYYLTYNQGRIVLTDRSDEEFLSFSKSGAEELRAALDGALKTYYKTKKRKK